MHKSPLRLIISAGTLLLFATIGHAQNIKFSGYGTVAAGTVIGNNDEPFQADAVTGSQYDDDIRFEPESLVALRATTDINDKFKATLQITGKGGESSDAFFEWAYVTYAATPETDINAGRYRLPLFYYSDFLDAGYAYHWIRPPGDVYGIPSSTVTGVNAINTHYFNNIGLTTQIWYGAEEYSEPDANVDITRSQGVNLMLEYEIFRLRGVYHTLKLGLDIKPFLVNTPGGLVQVDLPESDIDITYKALAFMVDYKSFIWRSEYTKVDANKADEATDSAYGSVGYIIGQFTPHYTYSYRKDVEESQTHTIGMRWDFMPMTALKFEYANRHYESEGGNGVVGPVAADEYRTELLSIALDFVF